MLEKIKNKKNEIDLRNLKFGLLILSFILLIISLILLKNHWFLIPIYLFLFFLSTYTNKNRSIRFLTDILFILLFAYFLLFYLDIRIINFNIKKVLSTIIKILFSSDYLMIIIWIIKERKMKYRKIKKRKKYTFKELRKNKFNKFKSQNEDFIKNYIEKENIALGSDYHEVINSNLDNKTKYDLEKYVHLEYLRFYKHKNYQKDHKFDKLNFAFILFHVTILLLIIIVR